MWKRRRPCVPTDDQHCLAAVLLGANCCPHGDCVLCEDQQERMRRKGFPEIVVARAWLRTRLPRLAACPVCGFPPPPPPSSIPPLPRLDRSERVVSVAPACRVCGVYIRPPKRFYCSHECWLRRRASVEGWGGRGKRRRPAPPARYAQVGG